MKTTFEVLPAMLSCSFAFAASAQDATISADVEAEAHATTRTTRSAEDADNKGGVADRHCLRATGSRVLTMQNAKPGKHCAIGPDQVHTSEDTQHTGTTSLG